MAGGCSRAKKAKDGKYRKLTDTDDVFVDDVKALVWSHEHHKKEDILYCLAKLFDPGGLEVNENALKNVEVLEEATMVSTDVLCPITRQVASNSYLGIRQVDNKNYLEPSQVAEPCLIELR